MQSLSSSLLSRARHRRFTILVSSYYSIILSIESHDFEWIQFVSSLTFTALSIPANCLFRAIRPVVHFLVVIVLEILGQFHLYGAFGLYCDQPVPILHVCESQ